MDKLDPNFVSFLASAPDAIIVADERGRIVGLNALTEEMFGYSRDELLRERIEILVPERLRGQHEHDRAAYSQTPRTRPMGGDRELWGRQNRTKSSRSRSASVRSARATRR